MPEVSLILSTYALPEHLRRVLASIAGQSCFDRLELIVSDDGSCDHTPEVVAEFARRTGKPVGFLTHPHTGFHLTRCRNDGARIASAPYLLFVDGDCLLPRDHVESYLRYRRANTVSFGYCVRLDQPTSERIQEPEIASGEFMRWAPTAELVKLRSMHRKALFYQWMGHATKPALKGGNIGIWRSDFDSLNGFDERYQAWGCEDDDLSHRARAAGLKVASMLGVTRTYHLWHPPANTKPLAKWSNGPNVAYLTRPLRLTRCLQGLHRRSVEEVAIKITGRPAGKLADDFPSAGQNFPANKSPEAEILCYPAASRFTTNSALKVVLAEKISMVPIAVRRQAHLSLEWQGFPANLAAELIGEKYLHSTSIAKAA